MHVRDTGVGVLRGTTAGGVGLPEAAGLALVAVPFHRGRGDGSREDGLGPHLLLTSDR